MLVKNHVIRREGCARHHIRNALTFQLQKDEGRINRFNNVVFMDAVQILMQCLDYTNIGMFSKRTLKASFLRAIDEKDRP